MTRAELIERLATIRDVRTHYATTGFPVDFTPDDPMRWVEAFADQTIMQFAGPVPAMFAPPEPARGESNLVPSTTLPDFSNSAAATKGSDGSGRTRLHSTLRNGAAGGSDQTGAEHE